MTITGLIVRLIDVHDKVFDTVEMPDLHRTAAESYRPRTIVAQGRKFREPGPALLDICPIADWHEVIE